ncbi:MAG: OmpA family protein, partial [Bryobacteraceae bacterium]
PGVQVTSAPMGTANRMEEPPTANTACTLPSGVTLPADGVASRLFGYVQSPGDVAAGTTWFNADDLRFNTGDATLRATSREQLNNIGEVMKGCPNVHLTIAGYTDNVGDEAANARLSKNRANAVRSQLVADGVSSDRLSIEGYGEQNPVADNSTSEGRAENRRVAIQVTQK